MLSGCQVCDWGIQYHLCSKYRGLWRLVVIQLLWLSDRALVAQARGVLGSIPGGSQPFHFPYFRLITSLFPAWGKMLWALFCIFLIMYSVRVSIAELHIDLELLSVLQTSWKKSLSQKNQSAHPTDTTFCASFTGGVLSPEAKFLYSWLVMLYW